MDVNDIKWFHKIKLPNGQFTPGEDPSEERWLRIKKFMPDLQGKTVLDIGAWDGFFSFKAESLGAERVLALDHHCWSGPGWGTKDGFDFAHQALDSKVESLDLPFDEIYPRIIGKFDVVICLGVLYHLKNFLTTMEKIAAVTMEKIMVAGWVDIRDMPEELPMFRFLPGRELHDDPTNWFIPNHAGMTAMLDHIGFEDLEYGIVGVDNKIEPVQTVYTGTKKPLKLC